LLAGGYAALPKAALAAEALANNLSRLRTVSMGAEWGQRSLHRMDWPGTGQIGLAAPFDERKVSVQGQIMETFTSDTKSEMTSKATAVYDPKPIAYKAVRVWLSDGSRMLGIWTGTKWWSTKGEIQPVKWELEERKKKKTDKLRKAIARGEKT
jgi:hypothetical protein